MQKAICLHYYKILICSKLWNKKKMQVAVSAQNLQRVLYWTLYLSLCFISGWFVSGVVENYISRKTSFYQDEKIATKRPVVSLALSPLSKEYPKLNKNTWIHYCPSYKLWPYLGQCAKLVLGENEFCIKEINKTEKVFLEQVQVEEKVNLRS